MYEFIKRAAIYRPLTDLQKQTQGLLGYDETPPALITTCSECGRCATCHRSLLALMFLLDHLTCADTHNLCLCQFNKDMMGFMTKYAVTFILVKTRQFCKYFLFWVKIILHVTKTAHLFSLLLYQLHICWACVGCFTFTIQSNSFKMHD